MTLSLQQQGSNRVVAGYGFFSFLTFGLRTSNSKEVKSLTFDLKCKTLDLK